MIKKRFIIKITSLLAVLLSACSLFTLTACADYDWYEEGDFEIGYSEKVNDAFVGAYFWRGHLGEDMTIDLPNTYNGAPVTALGGYCGLGVPTPFTIYFEGTDDFIKELFGDTEGTRIAISCGYSSNTQEEVLSDLKKNLGKKYDTSKEFEFKDFVFNLRIGSNLQKIELVSGTYVSDRIKELKVLVNEENEVLTVCAFSFEITVDEENEYFYSDDLGRMYYKENNNLVENFLYHNRETFPEHSLPY